MLMNKSFLEFENENDKLLFTHLDRYYFQQFQKPGGTRMIELIVKGFCPSQCEYCYLQKHLKDLYPPVIDKNDKILENLKLFLKWYGESNFCCPIELFSGRLFQSDGFGLIVLDTIFDYFKNLPEDKRPNSIIIPDDFQFLLDDKLTQEIEDRMDKFIMDLNMPILFSISVDGFYCDEHRFGKRTQDFYDKVFYFMYKYDIISHNMISAENVRDWNKGNYQWWIDHMGKNAFGMHNSSLETREDHWNKESILEFVKLLNDSIEFEFQQDHDKANLYRKLLCANNHPLRNFNCAEREFEGNDPWPRGVACALQDALHIRLGDLAIVPCHRTAYPQFVAGNFIVKDDRLDRISAKNTAILIATHAWKEAMSPKCHQCEFAGYCGGPCFGANFEGTGDLFYTPDSVCLMEKVRISVIILKLYRKGLFEMMKYINPQSYERFMLLRQKIETKDFEDKELVELLREADDIING